MSAPNLKEIEWAISELEKEESGWQVYGKLADQQPQIAAYSEAAGPIEEQLGQYGDSDFLRAVEGKDPAKAWAVMDELMETLQVVNGRIYDGVMRKLGRL